MSFANLLVFQGYVPSSMAHGKRTVVRWNTAALVITMPRPATRDRRMLEGPRRWSPTRGTRMLEPVSHYLKPRLIKAAGKEDDDDSRCTCGESCAFLTFARVKLSEIEKAGSEPQTGISHPDRGVWRRLGFARGSRLHSCLCRTGDDGQAQTENTSAWQSYGEKLQPRTNYTLSFRLACLRVS